METEMEMEKGCQNYQLLYSAIENGGNLWLVWAIGHNVKMPDLPNHKTHYVQVIVIPCMQRLHQFYQLEPKGVARGRELIKTDAAFACMVQLIYS